MTRRKDILLKYLKDKGLRQTKSKTLLINFFFQKQRKPISAKELHLYVQSHLPDVDRTTIYRNIEKLIELDVIQELEIPPVGKVYQFVFERNLQHYYICKACGKMKKGHEDLFKRVEKALRDIHDFSKANLSVVFYGYCSSCEKDISKEQSLEETP